MSAVFEIQDNQTYGWRNMELFAGNAYDEAGRFAGHSVVAYERPRSETLYETSKCLGELSMADVVDEVKNLMQTPDLRDYMETHGVIDHIASMRPVENYGRVAFEAADGSFKNLDNVGDGPKVRFFNRNLSAKDFAGAVQYILWNTVVLENDPRQQLIDHLNSNEQLALF